MEIITKSAKETKSFGRQFADKLKAVPAGRQGGETIALVGDLGSGKTTFVQGLAQGLGIEAKIISPTFVLMREYKLEQRTQNKEQRSLYHIDLYRLDGNIGRELEQLGLKELWEKHENIVVIEWADRAKEFMPESTTWITFEDVANEERKIVVTNCSK